MSMSDLKTILVEELFEEVTLLPGMLRIPSSVMSYPDLGAHARVVEGTDGLEILPHQKRAIFKFINEVILLQGIHRRREH